MHREPSDRLFDRLRRAIDDEEPQSLDAIRAEVAAIGLDPEAVTTRGLALFDTFLKRQRALQARRRLDAVRAAIADFRTGAETSIEGAKRRISEALAAGGGDLAIQANYQKLTSIEPEDILSLNDDVALLDFIERFEEPTTP